MQLSDGQREAIDHHRRWYDRYSKHDLLARWERQLREQSEAAICEAMVREELERHVDVVYPHEDLSKGGPDFQCFQKEGASQRHFYIETTCLTIEAVTDATGLMTNHNGSTYYRPLTQRFRDECRNKSKQLSGLDAPALLAITTLHRRAARCFNEMAAKSILTSDTRINQKWDSVTGEPTGGIYLSSDMSKSSFQRPLVETPWVLENASQSVSGILLCAFAGEGLYSLVGALHPNAARPFDATLLSGAPLFTVEHQHGGAMNVIQVCARGGLSDLDVW